MQKVCFIGSFTAGGTERITFLLVNELQKRYDDLELFVLNTKNRVPAFPLSENIHYSNIPTSGIISVARYVRKYITKNNIDVLVNIEALVGLFTIPATIGLKCRNIVWEHANYFQTQGSRWTRIVRKLWMRYADSYVVLTKRDYANFLKFERPKCRLQNIYNPIMLLDDSSVEYSVDSYKVISAGHLSPIKNFEIIPDIVKRYIGKYPNWVWEIYGGSSTETYERLSKKIKDYGLEGKVILKGRSNNMDDVYNHASIYALTSLQEGLPTVLLEAMLHGLPCVSFDIETGPDEIITNNEDGYIVPAYDEDKYAEALMLLMKSEKKRLEFSLKARQNIRKFNIDESVLQWHNVISGVKNYDGN